MTTTCAKHGRERVMRAGQSTQVQSTLDRARKLFADLSVALEAEIDRLQFQEEGEIDDARIKIVNDLIRQNQKTLGTVLEIEAKLMKQSEARQNASASVIDMEAARAEITRRLDRLTA